MTFARVSCSLAVGAAAALLAHADARAQTASTCSFDTASATVTVSVNGQATTVSRTAAGVIRLNGAGCGGATTINTDRIIIRGGPLVDNVSLSGIFAPGLTAESGVSEIEVQLSNIQHLSWMQGSGDDTLVFTGTGLDVGGDGDVDVTGVGGAVISSINGGPGNDTIDFSQHTGGNFTLDGGPGNDRLIGGTGNNTLLGGPGDDTLQGNAGNDRLDGGTGNDIEFGGNGVDAFVEGAAASGSDQMFGGAQKDTVDYSKRTVGVTVTLGDGSNDDGEPGEGDDVAADVENVVGGSGDDTLVGSVAQNVLTGGAGNDELFGGGNSDQLFGGPGNDFLQGDAGTNLLRGEDGNDVLVGSAQGLDKFFGDAGNDDITGTTDGRVEPVNCGDGTDTTEANDEDNFIGCE
jgi:Ca2+-binding RTX toxin-like protein